jgi:hypothetical protein
VRATCRLRPAHPAIGPEPVLLVSLRLTYASLTVWRVCPTHESIWGDRRSLDGDSMMASSSLGCEVRPGHPRTR